MNDNNPVPLKFKTRQTGNTVLYGLIAVMLVVAGIGGILFMNMASEANRDSETAVTPSAIEVAPNREPPSTVPVIREETRLEPVQSLPDQSISTADDSDSRNRFMEASKIWREEHQEIISSPDFKAFDKKRQRNISQMAETAIADFAGGQYAKAANAMELVNQQAGTFIEDRQRIIDNELNQAASAYQTEDPDRVLLHAANVLDIDTGNEDALAWEDRAKVLPEIQKLHRTLSAKAAENDLDGQIRAYEQIVALDPLREEDVAALENLKRERTERNFGSQISAGLEAVRNRDLASARKHLQAATKAKPNAPETKTLAADVSRLEKSLNLEARINAIQGLMKLETWEAAVDMAKTAVNSYPNNPALNEALALSNLVLETHAKLEKFINRPYRLSDPEIEKLALRTISEAEEVSRRSLKIADAMATLEGLLDDYNQSMDVTVQSDGETWIKVIGVGQVGKTLGRTIQLKPGKYVFEGTRNGYRDTRVELEIKPHDSNVTVSIRCTEQV